MSFWSLWPIGLGIFLSGVIGYYLGHWFGWAGLIPTFIIGVALGFVSAKFSIYLENRRVP